MPDTFPVKRNGYRIMYQRGKVFGVKCSAYPDTIVEFIVDGSQDRDAPTFDDLEARLEKAANVTQEWGEWWSKRKKA